MWRLDALYKNLAWLRLSRLKITGQGHRGQKTENCWVIPIDNACTTWFVGHMQQAAADDTVGIMTSLQAWHHTATLSSLYL